MVVGLGLLKPREYFVSTCKTLSLRPREGGVAGLVELRGWMSTRVTPWSASSSQRVRESALDGCALGWGCAAVQLLVSRQQTEWLEVVGNEWPGGEAGALRDLLNATSGLYECNEPFDPSGI